MSANPGPFFTWLDMMGNIWVALGQQVVVSLAWSLEGGGGIVVYMIAKDLISPDLEGKSCFDYMYATHVKHNGIVRLWKILHLKSICYSPIGWLAFKQSYQPPWPDCYQSLFAYHGLACTIEPASQTLWAPNANNLYLYSEVINNECKHSIQQRVAFWMASLL